MDLLTPEGFVTYRVVGTIAGIDPLNSNNSRLALLPLDALQRDFLSGERLVSHIDVVVGGDYSVSRVQPGLAALVRGVGFVQEPVEQANSVIDLTRGVRFMLVLASLMALLAAAYLIANNVLATVSERRLDLATLRALGISRARVRLWLLLEVFALGVLGSVLGVAIGILASSALARVVSGRLLSPSFPEVSGTLISLPVLVLGLVAGAGISVVAAFPSIRWITRGPVAGGLSLTSIPGTDRPREAKRYQQSLALALVVCVALGAAIQASYVPTRTWSLVSMLLVLATLLAAAAYLPTLVAGLGSGLKRWRGSPPWLRLAADSLRQNQQRTGAVAASLMITLAILVGVFGMARSYRDSVASWIDSMFVWDLMVSSSPQALRSTVPFNEAVGHELEAVAGVDVASPERVATVGYGSSAVSLYALDMAVVPTIRRFDSLEGVAGEQLPATLAGRRRVAISASLAPVLDIGVGDTLALDAPGGEVGYEVVAVVRDPGAAFGAVYLDRSVYVADWNDQSVDSFSLALAEGADPGLVTTELLERFKGRYPLQVVSAFKRDVNAMVTETFGLSQGLVLIAVLMALFGLLNAGIIAVWQLRHQMAVMRALGAPVGLASRTLLAEAWLTGALGGVFGLVFGTLLSAVLLRSIEVVGSLVVTWSWPFGGYLLVFLVVFLGSLVAASIPARLAERMAVTASLNYD